MFKDHFPLWPAIFFIHWLMFWHPFHSISFNSFCFWHLVGSPQLVELIVDEFINKIALELMSWNCWMLNKCFKLRSKMLIWKPCNITSNIIIIIIIVSSRRHHHHSQSSHISCKYLLAIWTAMNGNNHA